MKRLMCKRWTLKRDVACKKLHLREQEQERSPEYTIYIHHQQIIRENSQNNYFFLFMAFPYSSFYSNQSYGHFHVYEISTTKAPNEKKFILIIDV